MTLQQAFEFMYYDLLSNKPDVYLTPSVKLDYGCIRNVATINPKWYSEFCASYPRIENRKKNKPRTIIKRIEILRKLSRLKDGKPVKSKYLDHLKDIAEGIREAMDVSDEDMAFFIEFGAFPEPFNGQF